MRPAVRLGTKPLPMGCSACETLRRTCLSRVSDLEKDSWYATKTTLSRPSMIGVGQPRSSIARRIDGRDSASGPSTRAAEI